MCNQPVQSTIDDREYKLRLAEIAVEWVKTQVQVDSFTLPSLHQEIVEINDLLNSLKINGTEPEQQSERLPSNDPEIVRLGIEWSKVCAKVAPRDGADLRDAVETIIYVLGKMPEIRTQWGPGTERG